MIGQIIDDKKDCFGIYYDGRFVYGGVPKDLSGTWNWSVHLADHDVDYAYLYGGGREILDLCPEDQKQFFQQQEKRIKAFVRSFLNAKININDVCLFDVIPENHLRHYLDARNEICDWIFKTMARPKNYTFLSQVYKMTREMASQNVQINWDLLKKFALSDTKAMNLSKRIWNTNPTVNYNIFGSITGRLSTFPDSFPILNLKTEHRGIVIPNNDYFVELDYNGAEIRTLLSLSGQTQPQEDIHEWNAKHIFNGKYDRRTAKRRFLSWLYNPNNQSIHADGIYDRETVLQKHYRSGVVSTRFGRDIESDDFHSLNYLLQSSSSDNCLAQIVKIHNFLKDKKSTVAFAIHDSVVIDLAYEDRYLLPQIKEIFEDTQLGHFVSGMKLGTNLGRLKEFQW